MRARNWRNTAAQFFVLMAFWLILSGHYDVFHIALGALSVAVVILLNSRIKHIQFFAKDTSEWECLRFGQAALYIPWLVWQIVLSSLQVAFIVLHPRVPIAPSILRFHAKMPNASASVILGNSITLTPGTLTIEIQDNEYMIHVLTPGSSASLVDGTMPTKVARLFRKSPVNVVSDIRVVTKVKDL